jgi:serine/threonine protein kinase
MRPVDPDSLIGTLFAGRFQIERLLGRGGMGAVYLAQHAVLKRKVAVKVILAELTSDVTVAARFRTEARAASRIVNPHVTSVYDFGITNEGRSYLVMEYVQGETLAAALRREPLPLERAIPILLQVADGVAAAHASQVVHRDLKPQNIVLSTAGGRTEFVKILDFGLAKVVDAATMSGLTAQGMTLGTPEYMSPERCAGETADHRTDIYSFGVLAFELLTGSVPYTGSIVKMMWAHLNAPVPSVSPVTGVALPPHLAPLVRRCLAKKPDDRYQSVSELLGELGEIHRGLPGAGPIQRLRSDLKIRSTSGIWAGADEPAVDDEWEGPTGLKPPSTYSIPTAALCDLAFAVRDRGLGSMEIGELAAELLARQDRLLEVEVELSELGREKEQLEVRASARENRLRQALAQIEYERQRVELPVGRTDETLPPGDPAVLARLDENARVISRNINRIIAEAEEHVRQSEQRAEQLRASIEEAHAELRRLETRLQDLLIQVRGVASLDPSLFEAFRAAGM